MPHMAVTLWDNIIGMIAKDKRPLLLWRVRASVRWSAHFTSGTHFPPGPTSVS